MGITIKNICDGIVRISAHSDMPQNYLERYGIINVPEADGQGEVKSEGNKITLPSGRVLEFCTRQQEDDEFWETEENYFLNRFADKIPFRLNVDGRPGDIKLEWNEELNGRNSEKKFGISFKINDGEKFYGLGEAGRSGIQHRGGSYQNWVVYQFDEIAIPLVYSNENWGLFIAASDRHFVDIDDNAKGRLTVLGNFDELDVYLLYGDSMKDIIAGYTKLTGRSMLLPKWAYGLTYIAQIHQNQFDIMNDMLRFREKHIPCDNVSLEPGWMEKFYDYSFEKKWDLKKFHMEPWMRSREYVRNFPTTLRRFGFHLALWICVNYDLCDREESRLTGEEKIPAFYEHLKQFVNDGADGFKLDPADMVIRIDPNKIYTNGKSEFEMHNISQVILMKQMHEGFKEQMNKRPFIHYCGGYTGQQRWGACTTGDNGGLEGSMIWLENLAMSGFMNTTVDMNIHDIAAIHFGMLAPWAHHNAWAGMDQPWYAGAECEEAYTFYARLRYSIIPYIYSAAIECHETGVPMIRPMALEFQNDEKCSDCANQYMLGESMLISAFTSEIYLPEGKWIDFWTNEEHDGNCTISDYTPPTGRGGALFIRKGAIIPKWRDRDFMSQYGDEEIILHFYPYGESEYVFREDDGESFDYLDKPSCRTRMICEETEKAINIKIGIREGEYDNKPQNRVWKIVVHGTEKPINVICDESSAAVKIMNK